MSNNIRRHSLYIDAVFVKINGKQYYLWRAVDQYANNRAGQALLLSTIYSMREGTWYELTTIGI